MKFWYCILLIASVAGGYVAYPNAYPAITGYIKDGTLPWDKEPDPLGADSSPDPIEIPALKRESTSIVPTIDNGEAAPEISHRKSRPSLAAPEFASLDEVVGNWKSIPKSAFPRRVVLKSRVTYKIGNGTGTLQAGSKVVALSSKNGKLTVAPSEQSKMRAEVAIDLTDFKEVLGKVYDKFKQRKTREFAAAQKEARELETTLDPPAVSDDPVIVGNPSDPKPGQATGANTPLPPKPAKIDAKSKAIVGDAPLQYVDGTVPAMVHSMESGQVTEISKDIINYWGRMNFQKIEGEPYWVCSVDYTARSIFGIFPTQAKALMRRGKVIKWIYTGSEEPVP